MLYGIQHADRPDCRSRLSRPRLVAWFPRLAVAALLILAPDAAADDVLLFPYFNSNGENGVYLAWSSDGRSFQPLNNGDPIFTPPQWAGGQTLTRDPSIIFHDGQFHMVWTSNWNGNVFGYAWSPDLVSWSTPRQVQPFPDGHEQPNNAWAPELFWDHVMENYKIVWSSTLPSELGDGDGSEDSASSDHRMYYVSTTDFESFSTPELLFQDEGYSVIDAHVVSQPSEGADGRWVMTLKKELGTDQGGKNIRLAFSDAVIGPSSFGPSTDPVVGFGTPIRGNEQAEGPSLVQWNDQWLLYWDAYSSGHYSLASSTDLVTWTDETAQLLMPVSHPRHGSVFIADAADVGWRLGPRSDLNGDGGVDLLDWEIFLANNRTDLSSYSTTERELRGDLDRNGVNDFADFQLFRSDFLAANGNGVLLELGRGIPEPSAAALLLVAMVPATRRFRRYDTAKTR